MIITKTPLRISFAGGGTDLKSYYENGYGAVLSATINKYVYITVNKRFDDTIRLSYSKTEIVENVEDIQHDIAKACMKMTGVDRGVEITSIADIPAGTGLGSSGSFTVGLLNALYTYKGESLSAHQLADRACKIEIDILKHPIGKQDQFAAAYGGINYIRFHADDLVEREKIILTELELKNFNNKLMLFYTGIHRSADEILARQTLESIKNIEVLDSMRDQATQLKLLFQNRIDEKIATVLHEGWLKKRTITTGITNSVIDELYEKARKAGASGGKLLGAGGGGFILLYCNEEKQQLVRDHIGLREIDFQISSYGSSVVYFA